MQLKTSLTPRRPFVRNALRSANGDTPDEDLQFTEICSMFCSATRGALRQDRVPLTAAVFPGLARISPADPDSPALQMAYVGHLVSDAYEMPSQQLPGAVRQRNSHAGATSRISSLAGLGNKWDQMPASLFGDAACGMIRSSSGSPGSCQPGFRSSLKSKARPWRTFRTLVESLALDAFSVFSNRFCLLNL